MEIKTNKSFDSFALKINNRTNISFFFLIVTHLLFSQVESVKESQTIDVFLTAEKEIWIENELINFEDIKDKIASIINKDSFKLETVTTYRIFADENLLLDFIIIVEQEMLKEHNYNVKRERYLLNNLIKTTDDGFNQVKRKLFNDIQGINFRSQ